jgi:hypothetical protein
MSTTPNPNPPAPEDLQRTLEALRREREEHKATKTALSVFRADVARISGLPEDSPLEAIGERLTQTDALIQERTSTIAAERDEARKQADTLLAERRAERLDATVDQAIRKSGILPQCIDDAKMHLKNALEVDANGAVVTKAAPGVVPGQSAEWYIISQLRTSRSNYWPLSVGGKARGSAGHGADSSADTACFDPSSPRHSLTEMGRYLRKHGQVAFDRARARYGGGKW